MKTVDSAIRRLRAFELEAPPGFSALLERLRERRGLVALDSAAGWPRRWSWIAFDPLAESIHPGSGIGGLRVALSRLDLAGQGEVPGPFAGGFVGALAYDLGVAGEGLSLPNDPWQSPLLVGGLYTDFFVFDHERGRAWLVVDGGRGVAWRAELLQLARAAREEAPAAPFETTGGPLRLVPAAEHRRRIERAREYIAAGEIYQANLAHPFEGKTRGDPLELYLRLRETNPAPYMGYLRHENGALLSASPELLLEVEGRCARTRPIKGTIRRDLDPAADRRLAEELSNSAKDRAELAMIVDLERNDLGRVARTGTVEVEGFPTLRSYAGVHHLTADVSCELDPGRDAIDALCSLFPGGSITGAPKLRAMEVIAELEGEGRGFFCGSLGFLDGRGNALFNILIRTLVWRPEPERGEGAGRVRYHVGGGITWGSDPAAEDVETLVKGAKLAETLGVGTRAR